MRGPATEIMTIRNSRGGLMGAMISRCFRTLAVCFLLLAATGTQAGSIVGSKHDLSTAGTQLCGHCHAPHNASTQAGLIDAPLWNRKITNLDAYTPYTSPTMTQTCPTRPSGISLACLSCHDGAAGAPAPYGAAGGGAVFGGDQHNIVTVQQSGGGVDPNCSKCHTGTLAGIYSKALSMAGPDLSNDHPISMTYPVANSNYKTPPDATKGWGDVKLYNGKVECSTCHAVHDPTIAPFLVSTNGGSSLCLKCHNK